MDSACFRIENGLKLTLRKTYKRRIIKNKVNTKEVSIVQRLLPHYRVEFFNGLQKALENENIKLNLIYGEPNEKEDLKKDKSDVEWAIKIKNRSLKIGGKELYWQPCLSQIKNSNLVIVEQANKNLVNYWLLISRYFNAKKIAFWGHGRNLQDNEKSFPNRFKRQYINSCDWWFAYTSRVKEYLINNQFPANKITIVQNAINTDEIVKLNNEISSEDLKIAKQKLGIKSDNIAIYCGGIYYEKRIPFLVEAVKLIKQQVPDFHFIIIGSGSDTDLLRSLIKEMDWIHYLGPKFGLEKIVFFKMSKVFLMPGLVGLAVLDSFATETPLITTEYPYHSPEIEYLKNSGNGIISVDNLKNYVGDVVNILTDDKLLNKLKEGCRESSTKYSLDTMINNYKEGIVNCLNQG